MKQYLKLKLSQKLSPQQIQLMKLIQLPTLDFEQKIQREIEENPALEENKSLTDNENGDEYSESDEINIDDYLNYDDTPSYKLNTRNTSNSEDKNIPYSATISFTEYLLSQLKPISMDERMMKVAEFLVGSIDESGYIRLTIDEIIDDLAFTQNLIVNEEEINNVLEIIHEFDPAGVGAKNLQECLYLQLKRKKTTKNISNAVKIIKDLFDEFSKRHFDKIKAKLNLSDEDLRESISEIEKLNPKPGGAYNENTKMNSSIVPDFTVEVIDGNVKLKLNSRNAPDLYVSEEYKNMLSGYSESKEKTKSQKDAVMFIKQKLDSAKWFIEAIKQRNQTLIMTMSAIVDFQKEYFITGDEKKLKPMILKDIAEEITMDISTISRVANSKYVDTPYGTKLIKSFFSEGIKNSKGEDISTIEVKKTLESIIESEDKKKPLTDDQLTKLLNKEGYPIARRTVAKYREMIGAPVARLRRKL